MGPDGPPRLLDRLAPRAGACLAAAYLAFAAIEPRGGFAGLDVCLFHRATALPCPSCGLTRSLTHLWHLDPLGAWRWNPLGWLAFPLLLAAAAALALPRARIERARAWARAHARSILWLGAALLAVAFVFGAIRAAAVATGITTFPPGEI